MVNKKISLVLLKHITKAFMAIIIAALSIFFLSNEIKKLSNSLSEKKVMTLALQSRSENTNNIKNNLAIIGNNDYRISNSFLSTDDVSDLVGALETAAKQTSMTQILKFNLPQSDPEKSDQMPISAINYSSTLNGTIFTLINYLKITEDLPYFTKINAININAPTQGWETNSTINVQSTVFVK